MERENKSDLICKQAGKQEKKYCIANIESGSENNNFKLCYLIPQTTTTIHTYTAYCIENDMREDKIRKAKRKIFFFFLFFCSFLYKKKPETK